MENQPTKYILIHRIGVKGMAPESIPPYINQIVSALSTKDKGLPIIEYFVPSNTDDQGYSLTVINLDTMTKVEG